jgi:uncharacterized protein (TIGR02246 family)
MKIRNSTKILFPIVLLCGTAWGASLVRAANEPDTHQIAAITDSAKAFIDAFYKGDAKAVAAFWTPDGDYVDEHGRILKGRKAIEDAYAEVFANNKGLKLRIDVASVRFPAPDVAIEDGTTAVLAGTADAPKRARYQNVLVKKDGKWLLASVREAAYTDPTNYEFMRGLDWMIGEWMEDATEGPAGHITFEWAPGQNFIIATRTMEYNDASLANGMQMIGWDPSAKQVRSWSFEADGGHGESVWTKDGSSWVAKTKATLADGTAVTATNIMTLIDENTVKVTSKERTAAGKPLPDVKETTLKRVGESSPMATPLTLNTNNTTN